MHRRQTIFFTILFTLFLPFLPALAQIEGSYWMFSVSGDASVGIDGLEGTRFDVEDDFGYDDETAWGISLSFGSTLEVGASYLNFSSSARETISRTIVFRDLRLPVNADVSSEVEVEIIRGYLGLNLGLNRVGGGLLGGIQYFQLEGSASAPNVGRARAKAQAPMPIVGARLWLRPFNRLYLRGHALGMSWKFDDVDGTYIEYEAAAHLYLTKNLFAGGGYRHIDVDVTDKSEIVEVDLSFTGPVIFAGFAW